MRISEDEMQKKWDAGFGVKRPYWDQELKIEACDPPCEER
jgi:hypothetical protein